MTSRLRSRSTRSHRPYLSPQDGDPATPGNDTWRTRGAAVCSVSIMTSPELVADKSNQRSPSPASPRVNTAISTKSTPSVRSKTCCEIRLATAAPSCAPSSTPGTVKMTILKTVSSTPLDEPHEVASRRGQRGERDHEDTCGPQRTLLDTPAALKQKVAVELALRPPRTLAWPPRGGRRPQLRPSSPAAPEDHGGRGHHGRTVDVALPAAVPTTIS